MYIYIYIEREIYRERGRYIEREIERERNTIPTRLLTTGLVESRASVDIMAAPPTCSRTERTLMGFAWRSVSAHCSPLIPFCGIA